MSDLKTIISGGQNGADIAGWKAAKACGIGTAGWMPRGFRTLDGPRPEYAELYGAKEHTSEAYPPRTQDNVVAADATIVFAYDFASNGTKLTTNVIGWHRKPFLPLKLHAPLGDEAADAVARWLDIGAFASVNVAGNSERKGRPPVEPVVYPFLVAVFNRLGFPAAALSGEPRT